MMYQKIIIPIDHGNRNMKTDHKIFTSGFVESDCRPVLGEYLQYDGRYYALIPLMVSLFINSLYNFVYSMFVSQISEKALAALSLAAPVQLLVSALGLGNAVGLNAVISKIENAFSMRFGGRFYTVHCFICPFLQGWRLPQRGVCVFLRFRAICWRLAFRRSAYWPLHGSWQFRRLPYRQDCRDYP